MEELDGVSVLTLSSGNKIKGTMRVRSKGWPACRYQEEWRGLSSHAQKIRQTWTVTHKPSLPSEIKSETVEDAETGFSILNKKSHRSGAIQGMFLPLEKPARDLKAFSQASIPMGEKFREVWKYVSKLSWLEQ